MTGFPIIANDGVCILGHNCEHMIACAQLILLCGLAGRYFESAIKNYEKYYQDTSVMEEWKEWRRGIVGPYGRPGTLRTKSTRRWWCCGVSLCIIKWIS